MHDAHDEPFEGVGTLSDDAQSLDTAGTPAWLMHVRFESLTADVFVYGPLAQELPPLSAGQRVRVQGTNRSWPSEEDEPSGWVVIAEELEVIA